MACSVLFINHPHCTVLYLYDWQGFLTVATRQRPGYHDIRIGTNKPEITEGETTPATQIHRIELLLIALAGPHASREPDGVQYKIKIKILHVVLVVVVTMMAMVMTMTMTIGSRYIE